MKSPLLGCVIERIEAPDKGQRYCVLAIGFNPGGTFHVLVKDQGGDLLQVKIDGYRVVAP